MPTLARPGVALHYEVVGEGEPVLLLNGIMMTTSSWPHQVEALSTHHRVVLHDFRGQLRSPVAGRIRLQEHVDDMVALLDHLAIESADLVGTSYGGEIGMMFAAAHPSRVRRLVVIACTSEVDPPMRERVATWARLCREAPLDLYDASIPDIFSPAFVRDHPQLIAVARARVNNCPPAYFAGLAELIEAFEGVDFTGHLHRIASPTLVVAPELDVLKPVAVSRRIAENIPNAQLVVLAGAGHAAIVEEPQQITALIERFLHPGER